MKKWLLIFLITSSCYNDKFEALHPLDGYVDTCDTTIAATYSASIAYIVSTNCVSCHNSSTANGSVSLADYNSLVAIANDGRLLGTIEHNSGYNQMPPTGSIKDCDLAKIKLWVTQGMPQ